MPGIRHSLRLLVASVSVVAVTPVWAATYYAGPQGCSDSGEGTAASPFCTLKRAVSQLKAGDTLNLRTGTFKEQLVVSTVGTAASPVVIQADADALPVIEGQGLPLAKDTGLVSVSGAKYVTLRGFAAQNSSSDCVHVVNGDNLLLDRIQVTGCDHGGMVVLKTTNLKITAGEMGNTGRCTGGACANDALTLSGVSDFVVSGTWVHQGTKDGIAVKEGSRSGKIFTTVIQNMDGVGIDLIQASSIDVYDNDIHDNRLSGVVLTTGPAGGGGSPLANRNQVYRNLIWNNAGYGLRFWAQQVTGEMRENKIYNNDFFGNTQAGIQLGESTAVVKDNILRNNIFMNNTEGSILGAASAANTISHCLFAPPQASVGSSAVVGDPLFANTAFGNFHLGTNSPAIDKGFDMGLPKVGTADIGAFEYGLATIPDASKNDAAARPAVPAGPDPGCGCSSGAGVDSLAGAWPFVLLAAAWALRWRRRNGRSS